MSSRSLMSRLQATAFKKAERIQLRCFILLCRVTTGIKVSLRDAKHGSYRSRGVTHGLTIQAGNVSDEALDLAKDQFTESTTRSTNTSGKVTTLLTVTGLALSCSTACISLMGLPSSPWFYSFAAFTALIFFSALWLLFKFIKVGWLAAPDIDQAFLNLSDADKKAALMRDLMVATEVNNARNDFLVDVYKAGRRLVVLSLGCFFLLVVLAAIERRNFENYFLLKLRSDPELVKLLRGPTGADGQPGVPGRAGERGAPYLPPIDLHFFDRPLQFETDSLRLSPPTKAERLNK